jgi:hypothetical protein
MSDFHSNQDQLLQQLDELRMRIEKIEQMQASQAPAVQSTTLFEPQQVSVELPPPIKLEKLKYYREEDKHEWNLLSNRISSYITSQSFLVTAYAVSMGNQHPKWGSWFTLIFPLILSFIGISTSYRALPGITGAVKVIELWHKKRDRLFLQNPEKDHPEKDARMEDFRDDRKMKNSSYQGEKSIDEIHNRSLQFAVTAPWLFGISWVFFAILTIILHIYFP